MANNIPHIKHCKYINVKDKTRFRVILVARSKYRIEYMHKFLAIKWYDKRLKRVEIFAGVDDGPVISYDELIFDNIADCKTYIRQCCRNLTAFKLQQIILDI